MKFLNKKAYWRVILGVIPVLFLIFGGAYYWYQARHSETLVVKKTDIRADIRAPGKIIAAYSIDLGFEINGKISDIFVKEGDKAAFGDELARLDTANLSAELKQYQAMIELDKLRLSQLLSGARIEEVALAESKAGQTRTMLDNARKESDDLISKTENDLSDQYALASDYANTILLSAENAIKALAGIYSDQNKFFDIFVVPESQKKSEAEWQMMFARSALGNIKSVYESVKKDPSQKNIDQALAQFKINLELIRSALQKTAEIFETAAVVFGAPDLGNFKTTVAVQRSVINSAQTAVLTMEQDIASVKVSLQMEINKSRREIESLESALKTAEDELTLKKMAPREIEMSVYHAQIKENESHAAVLRGKLNNSVIKAPADGVVIVARERIGALTKAGEPIFSFASFSDVEIEAKISASDSDRVKIGDAVSIFIGDADYSGKVISINGGIARIYPQEEIKQALPGALADINIHSVLKRDVVLVPEKFIFEEDGIKKVNLLENNGKNPIAVITGSEWEGRVEIEEGISEGDVVSL